MFFSFLGQKGEGLVLVLGHVEKDGHALAHLPGLSRVRDMLIISFSQKNYCKTRQYRFELTTATSLALLRLPREEIKIHSLFTLATE